MAGQIQPLTTSPDAPGYRRPLQTHMVAAGRFKISAFEDTLPNGERVLRALYDGAVVARWRADRWSRPAAERRERPGRFDLVRGRGAAQTITLTKGRCY